MRNLLKKLAIVMGITCICFMFEKGDAALAADRNAIHVVAKKSGTNTEYDMPDDSKGDIVLPANNVWGEKKQADGIALTNIIGTDDRVLISNANTFPYTTIARITVVYQDGTAQRGSGAIIGPRLVATAGHVLINESLSHPKSIKMEFGLYGTSSYYKTSNYSAYIYYGDYKGYNTETDYGFIVLPEDVGTNVTGCMGIRTACDPNQAIFAAGYPGGNPYLYNCAGNVIDFTDDVLVINADFTAGESGGPVFVMYEGMPYLMGTISGSAGTTNYARRLNTGLLNWLQDNGYR